ncbi:enolase C-terminal domain-like protein [Actinomadura luteofluorescens]|uniref:enolase C-terminal domain-like protein n=1 Tax=Actinomadura luteofluorescens TaxID=46163 RepID=UPI003625B3AB
MIKDLSVAARSVPLARPWGADVPRNHVLVVTLTLGDGRSGTGVSWTPQAGAHAIKALLEHDVRDAVIGLPAHPGVVWDRLSAVLGEAGRSGIVPLAMAGVDLALWDLECGERPLAEVLGARRESVPVYGSGVNLHYTLDELTAQAERWAAAGYPAVKVKVGRPSLAEDVARVAAVRAAVGPDTALMIDANQRWDLHRARTALRALERFDLFWIEEPLPADDVAAHAELRRHVGTPIAVGENVATAHGFRDLLTAAPATSSSRTPCASAGSPVPAHRRPRPRLRRARLPAPAHRAVRAARPGAAPSRDGGAGRGRLAHRPRPARRPVPRGDHRDGAARDGRPDEVGAMTPVRVVVAGVHGYGRHHLDNVARLAAAGRARLAGVCDLRPPSGLGVPVSADLPALIRETGAEIAVIATPIHTHAPLAVAALEAGAHVLLEKPPAPSVEEFSRISEAVARTGLACQVGFQSLGSDAIPAARELLGPVRAIGVAGAWSRRSATTPARPGRAAAGWTAPTSWTAPSPTPSPTRWRPPWPSPRGHGRGDRRRRAGAVPGQRDRVRRHLQRPAPARGRDGHRDHRLALLRPAHRALPAPARPRPVRPPLLHRRRDRDGRDRHRLRPGRPARRPRRARAGRRRPPGAARAHGRLHPAARRDPARPRPAPDRRAVRPGGAVPAGPARHRGPGRARRRGAEDPLRAGLPRQPGIRAGTLAADRATRRRP